jgi:hypothetical protein
MEQVIKDLEKVRVSLEKKDKDTRRGGAVRLTNEADELSRLERELGEIRTRVESSGEPDTKAGTERGSVAGKGMPEPK